MELDLQPITLEGAKRLSAQEEAALGQALCPGKKGQEAC